MAPALALSILDPQLNWGEEEAQRATQAGVVVHRGDGSGLDPYDLKRLQVGPLGVAVVMRPSVGGESGGATGSGIGTKWAACPLDWDHHSSAGRASDRRPPLLPSCSLPLPLLQVPISTSHPAPSREITYFLANYVCNPPPPVRTTPHLLSTSPPFSVPILATPSPSRPTAPAWWTTTWCWTWCRRWPQPTCAAGCRSACRTARPPSCW